MKTFTVSMPLALAVLSLSACGGSKTNPVVNFDDTLPIAASSDDPAHMTVILTTLENGEVDRATGQYNRDDDTFAVANLTGQVDPATGVVALDGGGTVTLGLEQAFSGGALIERAGGTQFGVFGIPASNIPDTGSASYSGEAEVVIVDGAAVYELTGSSDVSVLFAGKSVDVEINNLNGQRTDQAGDLTDVTDVGRLLINSADLDGGDFAGGVFDIRSGVIGAVESGQETVTHGGALFGPDATEVGGTFTVDDTEVGSLLVQGVYTAD